MNWLMLLCWKCFWVLLQYFLKFDVVCGCSYSVDFVGWARVCFGLCAVGVVVY